MRIANDAREQLAASAAVSFCRCAGAVGGFICPGSD